MKLTIKIFAVALLIALASPVFMLNGCGKTIDGSGSGGCSDSVAPFGSSIQAPTLTTSTVPPSTTWCYPNISFKVLDPSGQPLNNICVEIHTKGAVALHETAVDCLARPATDFKDYIRTRSDGTGSIVVDYLIPSSCGDGSAATSFNGWVKVSSGSASGSATATLTVTPACP